MRKILIPFCAIFLLLALLAFHKMNHKNSGQINTANRKGTAIIITGAAAKISQEVALLEHLDQEGMLKDVVFISGASSGSLNTAVLNGILTRKISWDSYKKILFSLKNSDIFIRDGRKLPADTKPLHNLLTRIITDSLGYRKLSDLPVPSSISIVNLELVNFSGRTYRLSNQKINDESDPNLDLIEVLMASCSYPIAFPPTRISHVTTIPDSRYGDGGIAADHVPFKALIDFEKFRGMEVEKVIIISRKRDTLPNLHEELLQFGIDKLEFFDKLGVSPEAISKEGFKKRLREMNNEYPSLAERTFVYVPDFPEDFLMFDFSTLKAQYDVTTKWALTNEPIPLEAYLKQK